MIPRILARLWPHLVLAAYYIAILALQPPARWIPPEYAPAVRNQLDEYPLHGSFCRWIFDDCDIAAWVLRAENARRGRIAGGPEQPEALDDFEQYNRFVSNPPPLMPRYFLEYPPAALYFFELGQIGNGGPLRSEPVSNGLMDGTQFNTISYLPRNEIELKLYRGWRHSQRVYSFVLLAALGVLIELGRRGIGANGRASAPAWLFLLPSFLYFTPCRYDILPAALVVFAFAATDRKRILTGAVLLGLAVSLKMYPLVIAPILLRYLARSWKEAILWCVCFAVPIVLSYGSLALTDGWAAIRDPMTFQTNREPEPLWVLDGRFWPKEWLDKSTALVRYAILAAVVAACCALRPPSIESLLRRSAIAVTAFVCLQFFSSPQWWQWIAVLLIPVARTHRLLYVLIPFADAVSFVIFPIALDRLDGWTTTGINSLVYARGGAWLGIAIGFAVVEVKEWNAGRKLTPA